MKCLTKIVAIIITLHAGFFVANEKRPVSPNLLLPHQNVKQTNVIPPTQDPKILLQIIHGLKEIKHADDCFIMECDARIIELEKTSTNQAQTISEQNQTICSLALELEKKDREINALQQLNKTAKETVLPTKESFLIHKRQNRQKTADRKNQ
jgi:uncharacterized coiled-coil protein SlyX